MTRPQSTTERFTSSSLMGLLRRMLPLERLEMEGMASGDLSLCLTARVPWAAFGVYARAMLWVLGGRIASKADSPFERAWEVVVDDRKYWLCLNDWKLGVSLESRDVDASAHLGSIRQRLLAWRDGRRNAS